MPENFASGDEEEPARLLPSSILKICLRRQIHAGVTRRDPFRLASVVYARHLLVQTSQRSGYDFSLERFVLGCFLHSATFN